MNSLWQMWEAELSEEEVKKIITECELYDPQIAKVGNDSSDSKDSIRRSTVRWVNAYDQDSKFIYNLDCH